jgi:hypothetical protein
MASNRAAMDDAEVVESISSDEVQRRKRARAEADGKVVEGGGTGEQGGVAAATAVPVEPLKMDDTLVLKVPFSQNDACRIIAQNNLDVEFRKHYQVAHGCAVQRNVWVTKVRIYVLWLKMARDGVFSKMYRDVRAQDVTPSMVEGWVSPATMARLPEHIPKKLVDRDGKALQTIQLAAANPDGEWKQWLDPLEKYLRCRFIHSLVFQSIKNEREIWSKFKPQICGPLSEQATLVELNEALAITDEGRVRFHPDKGGYTASQKSALWRGIEACPYCSHKAGSIVGGQRKGMWTNTHPEEEFHKRCARRLAEAAPQQGEFGDETFLEDPSFLEDLARAERAASCPD